jgi:Zn-finger nucleic acid-binding protein
MRCPRDGSELTARTYEADVEIDCCPACRGTWLDDGELETIQHTVERDHSRRLFEPIATAAGSYNAVAQQSAPRAAACPRCEAEMDVRPYGMGSQIVIDVCPEGCGVWLDGGELESLERLYEQSQAESPLPLHWRIWAGVIGVLKRKAP